MPDKAKSRERQTVWEKSDRVIVPMKPGNAGGGKGATLATSSTQAPSGRRAGSTVNTCGGDNEAWTSRARRRQRGAGCGKAACPVLRGAEAQSMADDDEAAQQSYRGCAANDDVADHRERPAYSPGAKGEGDDIKRGRIPPR